MNHSCTSVPIRIFYKIILFVFLSIFGRQSICLASNSELTIETSFEHGDLHERILLTTKEISERPDSAFLYFKRGKLYFEHEKFEAAISDLDTASTLNYQGIICDLIYAKSYQQLNQLDSAMTHVEQGLHKDPLNVNALKIKGIILLSQKQYKVAAHQFELIIKHARRRLPENYLLAAKAWEADTIESSSLKAVAILKKGIEDLGPLYIFHTEIINILMKNALFEQALDMQKVIIQQAKRKEKPYYKAALISLQMNKPGLAKDYLDDAASAIKTLPPRLKNTTAIKQLRKNILLLLQQIESRI